MIDLDAAPVIRFLTQSADDPATRFRVGALLPGLAARGLTVSADVIPEAGRERRDLLLSVADADVVVLQRRLFNLRDQGRLRAAARQLVFDFDDAIMFKDAGVGSLTRSGRFSRVARVSDLVIAGNAYLADLARAYNKRVEIIPTAVDTERFTPRSQRPASAGPLIIGWIGSRSTVSYLTAAAPALAAAASALGERGIAVRFVAVSNEFGDLPERIGGAEVLRKPWSAEDEVSDLQSFDIGLMPLADDPWSRGKCGFKLLQYLASGVAAVADAVGVNCQILAPDAAGRAVGGLLARDADEMTRALIALAIDTDARIAMAARGRERVVQDWSVAAILPRLDALLRARASAKVSSR